MQGAQSLYSYDLYRHLRDHTPEFVDLAAFQAGVASLNVRRPGAATAEAFAGEMVSGNYFATLGVAAIRGRLLEPADDRPELRGVRGRSATGPGSAASARTRRSSDRPCR